jgi:hypothetical protein
MTNVTLPVSVRETRVRLIRIALFLGIIALCVSVAATRVERCRTVKGDFDARAFSHDFSIQPRTVCETESVAAYMFAEAWDYLKGR